MTHGADEIVSSMVLKISFSLYSFPAITSANTCFHPNPAVLDSCAILNLVWTRSITENEELELELKLFKSESESESELLLSKFNLKAVVVVVVVNMFDDSDVLVAVVFDVFLGESAEFEVEDDGNNIWNACA